MINDNQGRLRKDDTHYINICLDTKTNVADIQGEQLVFQSLTTGALDQVNVTSYNTFDHISFTTTLFLQINHFVKIFKYDVESALRDAVTFYISDIPLH